MPSAESYIRMRAFARVDGAKLGLMWIISFAFFIGYFHQPIFGMFWLATIIFTPFMVGILTSNYAQKVCDGQISYKHAFAHSVLTVFHASLILAIVQWAYFQYLDHGMVINSYTQMLSDPDFIKTMESMGYPKDTATQFVENMQKLRPIDIALQLLWSNMMAGVIMSLTTALYASSKKYWRPRN